MAKTPPRRSYRLCSAIAISPLCPRRATRRPTRSRPGQTANRDHRLAESAGPSIGCAMTCTRCGSEAPGDARFCPSCGAPLEASGIAEERKVVSVLFVDVVGSTERADGADPEDVRALNQLYYAETSARIEAYGGVVEKYVGDAVMAVFGAPVAHSDDAERAVRASLSVLEGIEQLNAAHQDLELQVRAAVSTGEAMVAVDAAPADALATGDVINTAARLQSSAAPGSAVV